MLSFVKLSGNYLCNESGRFIPTGVNWVPSKSAMQWPFEWNPDRIKKDFSIMSDMNMNFVRFDMVWQWVEPRPGQYNPKAFEQLDYLISLAHEFGIYLNPALFAGGEVGDAWWDIPWRQGRHPHTDSDLLFLQARHVEEFAKRYCNEPSILAWDLTDEPPFWVVMKNGQTSDAAAAVWTQLLSDSIRKYDTNHMVMVGVSNMELARGPFRASNISPWVDFLSVHPYPLYNQVYYPEPVLSTRSSYSAGFETRLANSVGKPVMMQEFGSSSAQCDLKLQARYYDVFMHSALAAGNIGLIAWTFTDADPDLQYTRAPYIRNPHETQFGITDHQGNARPNGLELSNMGKILSSLNLNGLELEVPQAAIILPHEWSKGLDFSKYGFPPDTMYQYVPRDDQLHHTTDIPAQEQLVQSLLSTYILSRQSGITASFLEENDTWPDIKLLIAPYPMTGSSGVYFSYHVYTTFWNKARDFIHAGGTLYASMNSNSAIPRELCSEICGVSMIDRARWRDPIQLTFLKNFGSISAGDTISFATFQGVDGTGVLLKSEGAEVIAVDDDGFPAITRHKLGKGQCIVSAYPLELLMGKKYWAFEETTRLSEFYKTLADCARIVPYAIVQEPKIEIGILKGTEKDLLIVVNHSTSAVNSNIKLNKSIGRLIRHGVQNSKEIILESNTFNISMEPFSGTIYEAFKS